MRRIDCVWLLSACLGAFLGMAPLGYRCSAEGPAPAGRGIEGLVKQLGSGDFDVREGATGKLMEREDAAPAVRQALKSSDAEVARRAAQILEAYAPKERKRALARLTELAKGGEVDRAAELFVRRPDWGDEDACWQQMADLAGKLLALEK